MNVGDRVRVYNRSKQKLTYTRGALAHVERGIIVGYYPEARDAAGDVIVGFEGNSYRVKLDNGSVAWFGTDFLVQE